MKDGKTPDPNTIHPIAGYDKEIYIKPTIKNPNIIVGDFSYIADSDFESHVTHHYYFIGDKLIIGKFCQISAGVEFIMNGANHQRNAATTFPFYTLEGWEQTPPSMEDLELKGDTVIGSVCAKCQRMKKSGHIRRKWKKSMQFFRLLFQDADCGIMKCGMLHDGTLP